MGVGRKQDESLYYLELQEGVFPMCRILDCHARNDVHEPISRRIELAQSKLGGGYNTVWLQADERRTGII